MRMESISITETAIPKEKINERHLLWHYSHFRLLCWLSWKM